MTMTKVDDAIDLVDEKLKMRKPCKCMDCQAEFVLVAEIRRLRKEIESRADAKAEV